MKYVYLLSVTITAAATFFFIREANVRRCEHRRLFVEDSIKAAQKERADSIYNAVLEEAKADKKRNLLLISKKDFTLEIWRDSVMIKEYRVALGKNPDDKRAKGDNATPLGDFRIEKIENSSKWTHDFNDGKGVIEGAYGPYFLRLKTGKEETVSKKSWSGIGIHGTHDNASIGTNASEGCVRMKNEELVEMMEFAEVGTAVKIRD